jgi:hypothetical protein
VLEVVCELAGVKLSAVYVVCSYFHTFAGGSRNERGQVRRAERERERQRKREIE